MIDEPSIVQVGSQTTAVIRLTVPRAEIRSVMGPGIQELMATVTEQGVAPTGPWYTHHLKMDPEVFDFEIGVPVASAVSPAGRVEPGMLPAATVARTIYHGGYEGLGDGWGEFETWIAANGHRSAPDLWEVYLTNPDDDPDPATWRTQLNRPLIT